MTSPEGTEPIMSNIFPNTIPAWMSDTPSVPACPPWCLEPAGHHTPTHVPGDWVRFHVAYQESFSTSAGELEVEVAEHEFWEGGVLHHEPAQLNVIGAEWLSQVDALRLREMVGQATAMLTRITGGAAMSTSHTRPEVAKPAPCPGWCTLPADHLDVEDAGWSRMHEAFSAMVPVGRGTRGEVKGAVVFVGQFESWYVDGGLSVQPPHLEVFDLGGGDPLFGAQAVALVAAMSEAGHALARIEQGVTA